MPELTAKRGNTVDILIYLFQCRFNAQQIPANNFILRFCVKLDTKVGSEINKLKDVPFTDTTIFDSIATAVKALKNTSETKQLATSYEKQLESLLVSNKKIVAEFQQQLAKEEELHLTQDDFFKNTARPKLIEGGNETALIENLRQFDDQADKCSRDNALLLANKRRSYEQSMELYSTVLRAFNQIKTNLKEEINLPEPDVFRRQNPL